MANDIYKVSWWGTPTPNGWGSSYYKYVVKVWESMDSTWSKITNLWN
tara:strand:+ start:3343 stop:3483 length:141 start_codon:yes stop_codon:yes gene_type:complete